MLARCIASALAVCLLVSASVAVADEKQADRNSAGKNAAESSKRMERDKDRLTQVQTLVGQWRGVGMLRRGSSRGSWRQDAEWQWRFEPGKATLHFDTPAGKYFSSGKLRPLEKAGEYRLEAVAAGDDKKTPVTYTGALDDSKRLVLVADQPAANLPARISIRQVADGDRLIVLLERRSGTTRFLRLAEVGYTRKGSKFGQGGSYVECIVTGGKGTIPVTFEGKTYYVCCSGCRDYFNDNPAEVIAEYRARREAKEKAP